MKVQPQTVSTTDIIRSLPTLPKDQLLALWQQHFGQPVKKLRRELLIPVLAFRIQEKTHGGLNADTTRRIQEIVDTVAPKGRTQSEARHRFKTGTKLVREWKGQIHEVVLTDDGYEHQGKIYKSLSPIASTITGTNWSGPAFFGTKKGIKK